VFEKLTLKLKGDKRRRNEHPNTTDSMLRIHDPVID